MNHCEIGDCREIMRRWIAEGVKVQMCVTSPPYWGLRDYGTATWEGGDAGCDHLRPRLGGHGDKSPIHGSGHASDEASQIQQFRELCRKCGARRIDAQLGLESTPQEYVENLVAVFRLVRELLADDGTLWLNLGDSYSGSGKGGNPDEGKQATNKGSQSIGVLYGKTGKTARPMPESVRDRCTKSHEYIFLLSKNATYYYDAEAIAEPLAYGSLERLSQPTLEEQSGSDRVPGKTNGPMKAVARESWRGSSFDRGKTGEMKHTRGYTKPYTNESTKDYASGGAQDASATKARIVDRILAGELVTRNKRSVWTVTTKPFSGAHFATFPPDLIEPCILAGSKPGDTVLDPFMGSGTTGQVAQDLGRQWLGCELNTAYEPLQKKRTEQMGLVL